MRRAIYSLASFLALPLAIAACNDGAITTPPSVDAGETPPGLTSDQAQKVIAKIGERAITLGEFAKVLDRMDQFDRLRYQTKERRHELLTDMIDVELLATEAKRRGLDKDPEVEDAIRQILRDAMLAKARAGIPAPAEIPAEQVRAYYDANQDKFVEPERRRVAAIVLSDKKEAEKVLKAAQKIKNANEWGDLYAKSSPAAKAAAKGQPVDLAGDLGIVGPPEDARGANPKVPDAVRAAAFKMPKEQGAIANDVIEAEGKFFVLRLNGITEGHKRTLAEADRSIRVMLLQQQMADREAALKADLRKRFPVEIDDRALAGVKLPSALEKIDLTGPSPWAGPAGAGPAADGGAPPAVDAGAPANGGH